MGLAVSFASVSNVMRKAMQAVFTDTYKKLQYFQRSFQLSHKTLLNRRNHNMEFAGIKQNAPHPRH